MRLPTSGEFILSSFGNGAGIAKRDHTYLGAVQGTRESEREGVLSECLARLHHRTAGRHLMNCKHNVSHAVQCYALLVR